MPDQPVTLVTLAPSQPAQSVTPDWSRARQLYASGVSGPRVAAQCGITWTALRKRASRESWSRDRSAVTASVDSILSGTARAELSALAEQGRIARERLASELDRAISTLSRTNRSTSLRSQSSLAGTLHTIASTAKIVHGWSDSNQPSIRIDRIEQAVIASPQSEPSQSSPKD